MKITDIRILLRDDEKLRAFVSVTFDDAFAVRGMKIIEGAKGLFVAMPSRKRPDGSHEDIAHPVNREFRQRIQTALLEKYRQETESDEAAVPVEGQ